MTKRIKKKIQKAKILAEKTIKKHSTEESERVVSDRVKKIEPLRLPKDMKVNFKLGKKSARKAKSATKKTSVKQTRTKAAETKRQLQRIKDSNERNKLPPPPIPEGGRKVRMDYHIGGDYDGSFHVEKIGNGAARGLESAMNRVAYEHPEIQALINEYYELRGKNPSTIRDLGYLFVEYYFDPRKDEFGQTQYMEYEENLYAVYEEGYAEFKAALEQANEAARRRIEAEAAGYWGDGGY